MQCGKSRATSKILHGDVNAKHAMIMQKDSPASATAAQVHDGLYFIGRILCQDFLEGRRVLSHDFDKHDVLLVWASVRAYLDDK